MFFSVIEVTTVTKKITQLLLGFEVFGFFLLVLSGEPDR
jgi:hypothetical protein